MNCWVYRQQQQQGVELSVGTGSSIVPIKGGRGDMDPLQEKLVSVWFQCQAGVTPASTLFNPCPPHPASPITSFHYVPICLPPVPLPRGGLAAISWPTALPDSVSLQ
ncbi:hypothetical protein PBY51_024843 [Eleginops maclovinus]|uniref:Uncharacterized protein n=1 Tax=Eleginops maclovinus TaxID=56733 RepID=A0AAN8AWE1_ELEMC|nr:hypothetical protein PBY51_024843 [Eleginops maclovinus]